MKKRIGISVIVLILLSGCFEIKERQDNKLLKVRAQELELESKRLDLAKHKFDALVTLCHEMLKNKMPNMKCNLPTN